MPTTRRIVCTAAALSAGVLLFACSDSPNPTDVEPGRVPASAILLFGDGQTTVVGEQLAQQIVLKVLDESGKAMGGVDVAWITETGSFTAASSVTDLDGRAVTAWVLGSQAGVQTAEARVNGLPAIPITATALPDAASAVALDVDSLFFDALGDSVALAVTASDRFGNAVDPSGFQWTSSDTGIAVVSDGRVRSRGAGLARITVTGETASADVPVVVTPLPVTVGFPADTITIEAMLDSLEAIAEVRDRNGNLIAADVEWSLLGETRWVSTIPVLGAAALSHGWLNATGAGIAEIQAEAGGVHSPPLHVRVAPSQPVVQLFSAPDVVGSTDTLVLGGYRLDALEASALTVFGTAVQVLAKDSATIRAFAPAPPAACIGAATVELAVSGAIVQTSLALRLHRPDEIVLAPGQGMRLEDTCIKLPPGDGSLYVLAYYDDRHIIEAESQPEREWATLTGYTVLVRDATSPQLTPRPVPQRRAPGSQREENGHSHIAPVETGHLAGPMAIKQVGDTVTIDGRVERVVLVRDRWVVSALDSLVHYFSPGYLANIDSAIALVDNLVVPRLKGFFTPSDVRTWPGADQFLITFEVYAGDGTCGGNANNVRVFLVCPSNGANLTGIASTLAHELTHSWQVQYLVEEGLSGRPALWPTMNLGPNWRWEAGASLIQVELGRWMTGNGLFDNTSIGSLPPFSTWAGTWQWFGFRVVYYLAHPYATSRYLHDLLTRSIRDGGLDYDTAMRRILRGSLYGWHACNQTACFPELSLAGYMRMAFGAEWNPTDAGLTFILSQLMDDRTSSEIFSNPVFANVWRSALNPHPTEDRPVSTIVTGEAGIFTEQPSGGEGGAVYLQDDGIGGSISVQLDINGAWMIARIH